jgi:acyl carrier protein
METSPTNIKDQIRRFVIDQFLFGEGTDLSNDASFLEKGIIDSTGVLELVAFLVKAFGINVGDEELLPDNLDSVDAAGAFVQRKLGGGPRVN